MATAREAYWGELYLGTFFVGRTRETDRAHERKIGYVRALVPAGAKIRTKSAAVTVDQVRELPGVRIVKWAPSFLD